MTEIQLLFSDMKRIRVLIVDEHSVATATLCNLLRLEQGIEIAGLAANTMEAAEMVGELLPDVVVIDRAMATRNGGTMFHDFAARSPGTRMIVLTGFCQNDRVFDAARPGRLHVLSKYAQPGELARTIRALCSGEPAPLSP